GRFLVPTVLWITPFRQEGDGARPWRPSCRVIPANILAIRLQHQPNRFGVCFQVQAFVRPLAHELAVDQRLVEKLVEIIPGDLRSEEALPWAAVAYRETFEHEFFQLVRAERPF